MPSYGWRFPWQACCGLEGSAFLINIQLLDITAIFAYFRDKNIFSIR